MLDSIKAKFFKEKPTKKKKKKKKKQKKKKKKKKKKCPEDVYYINFCSKVTEVKNIM